MSDIGDTLKFSSDLFDKPVEQGGVLVNASSVTLTVALPDGTTAAPTVANPPAVTGKYLADYTAVMSGRHKGVWLFTMSGGKTTSYEETFDVGPSLVTVDEALAHLRAAGIVTSYDDLEQLQWLCFVATDAIERDLGRKLTRGTVVETHDGGSGAIILRQTPVVSITSVSESGTALTVDDWTVDAATGILYRGNAYYSRGFAWGRQNVTITYIAGYADPPRIARKVALNTIQAMWQESQQASHPLLDEGGPEAFATQVASAMSMIEQRGYESLRAVGIA